MYSTRYAYCPFYAGNTLAYLLTTAPTLLCCAHNFRWHILLGQNCFHQRNEKNEITEELFLSECLALSSRRKLNFRFLNFGQIGSIALCSNVPIRMHPLAYESEALICCSLSLSLYRSSSTSIPIGALLLILSPLSIESHSIRSFSMSEQSVHFIHMYGTGARASK